MNKIEKKLSEFGIRNPMTKAYWIEDTDFESKYKCSECGKYLSYGGVSMSYCSFCGAQMFNPITNKIRIKKHETKPDIWFSLKGVK